MWGTAPACCGFSLILLVCVITQSLVLAWPREMWVYIVNVYVCVYGGGGDLCVYICVFVRDRHK